MTDLVKISPTQLKTKRRCFRKWGFQKIEGLEDPPGRGALLGLATHALVAKYYSGEPYAHLGDEELVAIHEEAPKARRLADALIAHYGDVPDPLVEVAVEVKREGYILHGFADLGIRAVFCAECEGSGEDRGEMCGVCSGTGIFVRGRVLVCDHKTSKDPERYAMTDGEPVPMHVREKNLREDEQGVIYGAWAMEHFGVEEVELQWTYVATQGRARILPVRTILTRADVEAAMPAIDVDAREIVRARREVRVAMDLPHNPAACGDFGGCPFVERCPRSLEDKISGIFAGKQDNVRSLRDIVREEQEANAAANTDPKPETNGRRQPPPRGPDMRDTQRNVNAPESPPDEETRRDMSRAAGPSPSAGRTVAETVARGGTPDDGAGRAAADAAARKSPKRAELLEMLARGIEVFTSKSDKATADQPFAHLRTLKALAKDGLAEHWEIDSSTRGARLTAEGRAAMGVQDAHEDAPDPATDDDDSEKPVTPEVEADTNFEGRYDRCLHGADVDDFVREGRDAGMADAIAMLLRTGNRDEALYLAQTLVNRLEKWP